MELLNLIDMRIGRWLAYVDSCVNAEGETARCQPFWSFVATVLAVICIVVLVSVVARIFLDKRKESSALRGDARYKRPS